MKRCRAESFDPIHEATDFQNEDEQHPVLVEYRPAPTTELDETKLTFGKAGVANKKLSRAGNKSANKSNEVLSCELGKMQYRGHRSCTKEFVDTFIVVRNRKTNELHFVESELRYTMRPISRVSSSNPEEDEDEIMEEEANQEKDDSRSITEQREELLRLFGARKSQKRYETVRREAQQRIRSDLALEHATKAAELVAKQEEKTQPIGDGSTRHLVPPHDLTCKDPAGCYPMLGIATPALIDHLREVVKNDMEELNAGVEEKLEDDSHWYEPAFNFFLAVRGDVISEEVKEERAVACYYLSILIRLNHEREQIGLGDQKKLCSDLKMTPALVRDLLDLFFEPNGKAYRRTRDLKDKMMYYVAVLFLTLKGFKKCEDIGHVAGALRITPKEMVRYLMRVGAKMSKPRGCGNSQYSEYVARLEAPLVFPKIEVKRRRRSSTSRQQHL